MHPWFKPNQYVDTLKDVDPADLHRRGIRGVLLDLDNTLVTWKGSELEPEMEDWVRRAREAELRICIVSNTWKKTRIQHIAERLGIPYILRAGKPRRGSLRRAMDSLGTSPSETAVIGDQIFTDIMGGNRIGAYTILCVPLPGREFFGTRLTRVLEAYIMKGLVARGHITAPVHKATHIPGPANSGPANSGPANSDPEPQ